MLRPEHQYLDVTGGFLTITVERSHDAALPTSPGATAGPSQEPVNRCLVTAVGYVNFSFCLCEFHEAIIPGPEAMRPRWIDPLGAYVADPRR